MSAPDTAGSVVCRQPVSGLLRRLVDDALLLVSLEVHLVQQAMLDKGRKAIIGLVLMIFSLAAVSIGLSLLTALAVLLSAPYLGWPGALLIVAAFWFFIALVAANKAIGSVTALIDPLQTPRLSAPMKHDQ